MALPAQIKAARMGLGTTASTAPSHLGDLEAALSDLLGIPLDTAMSAGSVMTLPLAVQMSDGVDLTWGGTATGITGSNASGFVSVDVASTEVIRITANGIVWAVDTDTYISHPAADSLAMVMGGSEIARFTANGLTFGGDLDTYIGLTGANEITVTAGGAASVVIDDAGMVLSQATLVLADDLDTFLGHASADVLALYTGGSARVTANNAGLDVAGVISIDGDTDTYFSLAAANQLAVTAGGTEIGRFTSSGFVLAGDTDTFLGHPAADTLAFTTGGAERARITSGGNLFVGDTANSFQTKGLTLNQATAVDEIVSLKRTGVSTGFTAETETDTYGKFSVVSPAGTPNNGGLAIMGLSSGSIGFMGIGAAVNPDTTDTGSSVGVFTIDAYDQASNALDSPGATSNVLVVRAGGSARFLVKGNGTLHASDTDGLTALDEYDDVALIRAMELQSPAGIIRSRWDEYVRYNKQSLIEAGVYSPDGPDGSRGLINLTQHRKLVHGAIWQLYQEMRELKECLSPIHSSESSENYITRTPSWLRRLWRLMPSVKR